MEFNCSLLKDKNYLIMINSLIDQIKPEDTVPVYKPENISRLQDSEIAFTISDRLFLETMILKIRGETIKYSSTINKKWLNIKRYGKYLKFLERLLLSYPMGRKISMKSLSPTVKG